MLTLLLLRHAKAEPAVQGDDFSRDLTERGVRDAGEIGDFIAAHRLVPQVALVSPARRTARTMALVAARAGNSVDVRPAESLYNASDRRILDMIGATEAGVRCLAVVGHNPGLMEAAVALAASGDRAEIERLAGRFPPGGLVVLGFEAEDWRHACAAGGRLDALVFPEDLRG